MGSDSKLGSFLDQLVKPVVSMKKKMWPPRPATTGGSLPRNGIFRRCRASLHLCSVLAAWGDLRTTCGPPPWPTKGSKIISKATLTYAQADWPRRHLYDPPHSPLAAVTAFRSSYPDLIHGLPSTFAHATGRLIRRPSKVWLMPHPWDHGDHLQIQHSHGCRISLDVKKIKNHL